MASKFTFVTVKGSPSLHNDGIEAGDRLMIRSLAATNPWNRPLEGEVVVPGRRRRTRKKTQRTKSSMRVVVGPDNPWDSQFKHLPTPGSDYNATDSSEDWAWQESRFTASVPLLEHENLRNEALGNAAKDLLARSCNGDDLRWIWESPTTLPYHIRSDRLDPFWTLSIPHRPFLSAIIDHRKSYQYTCSSVDTSAPAGYTIPIIESDDVSIPAGIKNMCPALPGLEDPLRETFLFKRFKSKRDSPIVMYADLLWAAAQYYTRGNTTRDGLASIDIKDRESILWLKGSALSALNNALQDETTRPDDNVLCAIIVMASFEHVFGDPELHVTHMRGARRLLAQRGGVTSLEESSKQLFAWLIGTLCGSDRLEKFVANSIVVHPSVWTGHILGTQIFLDVVQSQLCRGCPSLIDNLLETQYVRLYESTRLYEKLPSHKVWMAQSTPTSTPGV